MISLIKNKIRSDSRQNQMGLVYLVILKFYLFIVVYFSDNIIKPKSLTSLVTGETIIYGANLG